MYGNSPAWRYETARAAARQGRALVPSDADSATRALTKFLVRERLCTTAAERRALADQHPDVAAALALDREPCRGTAAFLDSLILSRASNVDVACRTTVPSAVFQRYAQLFFDIGDRIDDPAYVLYQVIGAELRRGAPANARRNAALKLVGYFGGLAGLDQLFASGRRGKGQFFKSLPELATQLGLTRDIVTLAAAALSPDIGAGSGGDDAPLLELAERVTAVARPTAQQAAVSPYALKMSP